MLCAIGVSPAAAGATAQCGEHACNLEYYGGPIMPAQRWIVVDWTSGVDSDASSKVPTFIQDESATTNDVFDALLQYSTIGVTPTGGQTTGSDQVLQNAFSYGGAHTITPTDCSDPTKTCTVTDTEVQAELKAQIADGNLPAPDAATHGLSTGYLVQFPADTTETLTVDGQTETSGEQFCEYHNWTTTDNGATDVLYAVLPSLESSNTMAGCSLTPPAGLGDRTALITHVQGEMMTDPLVSTGSGSFAYPSAWADPNNGEVGSMCNFQEESQSIDGTDWTIQQLYSKSAANCVSTATPPSLPIASTGTATAIGDTDATLNGTVNPGGTATAYRFEYGTSMSLGSSVPVPDAAAGADSSDHQESQTLSGLMPGTPYYYRIVAIGEAGDVDGTTGMFTTTGSAVTAPSNSEPPTISGSAVQGQTLAEAHGTWTGSPTGYGYSWEDCNASGVDCTPIAASDAQTFTLRSTDIGHTLRVVETATNVAGSGPTATSSQTAVVTANAATLGSSLSAQLAPGGKAATIKALLQSGTLTLSITALEAGTETISWYYVPKGATIAKATHRQKPKAQLIASGKATFTAPGFRKLVIKLTHAGHEFLRRQKRVSLVSLGTFKPRSGPSASARKKFTLKR